MDFVNDQTLAELHVLGLGRAKHGRKMSGSCLPKPDIRGPRHVPEGLCPVPY